ncbi:hypothetical protein BGX34_005327 [Mortierella sp. NVP85]|nr:hypothetical protein BGX34_005327 [Mortierella sp. NVP85]
MTATLYVDGSPPVEKKKTNQDREKIRSDAIQRAQTFLDFLEARVNGNHRVRKRHFTRIIKAINTAFYWTMENRTLFIKYMRSRGWNVKECSTEADVDIARDCKPDDIVVSGDSDMLAFAAEITTIWRPISRSQFLIYHLPSILGQLRITRAQLTALCIVSKNDYNRNISLLGPKTNFDIVRSLEGKDAVEVIKNYLGHGEVVIKNNANEHFEASTKVFVHRNQTKQPAVPIVSQTSTQGPVTHGDLAARLNSLRERLRMNKEATSSIEDSSSQSAQLGPVTEPFDIYRTIDRPPEQWPPCHNSGRRFKYRKRYSFKTRSRSTQHPPPDIMKRYSWKEWKEKPDSPTDCVPATNHTQQPEKPKKTERQIPKLVDENRKDLLYAFRWEHPTRTLNVGTLNANVGRVLNDKPSLCSKIKACLREVVCHASRTKRICQRAIGQYVERLSTIGVDDTDRKLLDLICPRITAKGLVKNESLEEAEEEPIPQDDENITKDKQASFLSTLLQSIYTKDLPSPHKGMGNHVRDFIKKAKDFLPAMHGAHEIVIKPPYPASTILRSTATQLSVELKNHFRKGSKELCEKITTMKNIGLLPANTTSEIDFKKSTIENFVALNKVCGGRRKPVPLSTFESSFVSLSEPDLIAVFWHDDDLKALLRECVKGQFNTDTPSKGDIEIWLSGKEPGHLITKLLTDIGSLGEA